MIGALAIKNRRKQLGIITGANDGQGPPPVPSPLANRVHMCYFVAFCCIIICIVISIPAIVSDSSLFYYAGVAGGVGFTLFLVTCFLSPPESQSSDHQTVKVEPVSKPSALPCSPAPSSCSGRVYPRTISRSARLNRGESTDTAVTTYSRAAFSRDQSLDIVSVSNIVGHDSTVQASTPAVNRETSIEMPPVDLKSGNWTDSNDVAETSIIER